MGKGPKAKPIKHGTHSGFNTHRNRSEKPCGACHAGERAYQNKFDRRGKCAPGLGWPLLSASENRG